MKRSMFSIKAQKGFTLLELLVVVAIIAILSVGAIFAYDGLTDKAQSATASFNTVSADQGIRNFRVVTGNYPNQWDHLVAQDGGSGEALEFVADETYRVLAKVNASAVASQIVTVLEEVGMDEFQTRADGEPTANAEPNLQHNEGATSGESVELEFDEGGFFDRLVVVPTATSNDVLCQAGAGGTPVAIVTDSTANVNTPANAGRFINKVNDNIGEGGCHLIAAFGFGHDAAHSTTNSNAAIAAAPSFVSRNINPAETYARYIALFDLGVDRNEDGIVDAAEITASKKAKFIGLLDTEGNVIDENIAESNDEGQDGGDDD